MRMINMQLHAATCSCMHAERSVEKRQVQTQQCMHLHVR